MLARLTTAALIAIFAITISTIAITGASAGGTTTAVGGGGPYDGPYDGPKYCPRGDHDGVFVRHLIGLSESTAQARARAKGCSIRPLRVDGEWQLVTQEVNPRRINVAIRDGRVTRIYSFG